MQTAKRILITVASVVAAAILFTGCSTEHSHPQATAAASAVAHNAAVQQAKKAVKQCISQYGFFTPTARRQLIKCVAPAGHGAALESCVTRTLYRDGFFTRTERAKFTTGSALCVVNNR